MKRAGAERTMHIDAHQHFWRIADRQGCWPPPELARLRRDFEPADLLPALERCRIGGTVLVQSLPTPADTEFLLEIAARHALVLGVVGWVDMAGADARGHIARLAAWPKLKGLRPMLQDEADDSWFENPAVDASARAMLDHGLVFDALVRAHQLAPLRAFARRHPHLPIVIDHAGKPAIEHGDIEDWSRDLAALAALPNVHCKLSGLLTEAGPRADVATLAPYAERIFSAFGSHRVMWGSDWPVLCLVGDYERWFAMAQTLCSAQRSSGAAAITAVFGANARALYNLH